MKANGLALPVTKTEWLHLWLGKRTGKPKADDAISKEVQRYLTRSWNSRQPTTDAINAVMNTDYEVMKNKGKRKCI